MRVCASSDLASSDMPMSCSSIMVPDDIKISHDDTRRIKLELDTCINVIQGTSPEQLKELRDEPEALRILYRTSNLNKYFMNLYDEEPRNWCEDEEAFFNKTREDDRYITLSNDSQADMYVTNVSRSSDAYFSRLNVLNIVKTWANADLWRNMSNSTPPFILKQDQLVLQPYHNYGKTLRVRLNGTRLLEAISHTSYTLRDGARITVEISPFKDDLWQELFTFVYYFKDTNRKAEKATIMKRCQEAEREVESARMALENNLKKAKSLTETLETKIRSCSSCVSTLGMYSRKCESYRARDPQKRWRQTNTGRNPNDVYTD
jgi:hypothetical protein